MGRAGCSFDPCCSKMPAVRSGCPPSASLSAHGPLDGTPTPHCPFVAARSMHLCSIRTFCEVPSRGTWCSGITSASHAEGPGFKSQCVHAWWCQYSWSAGNTARSRWGRPGKSLSAPPYDHLILAVQWRAEPGCLIIADGGQRHPGGAGLATGGTMQ